MIGQRNVCRNAGRTISGGLRVFKVEHPGVRQGQRRLRLPAVLFIMVLVDGIVGHLVVMRVICVMVLLVTGAVGERVPVAETTALLCCAVVGASVVVGGTGEWL